MKTHTKTLLATLTASAMIAGSATAATVVLLNPLSDNGDFNDQDTETGGVQTDWVNLNTYDGFSTATIFGNPGTAATAGKLVGSSNTVMRQDRRRTTGLDLGYTIGAGDTFDLSFYAKADSGAVELGEDSNEMILYYTTDNTIQGTVGEEIVLSSGTFANLTTFQLVSATSQSFTGGVGNSLFVRFEHLSEQNDEIIAVDNVSISVIPEPSSLALLGLGGLLIARRRRG